MRNTSSGAIEDSVKNMTLRNTLFFSVWSLCRRVSVQCFLLSQQLNEAFVSVDPESQTSYELESRPAAFKTNKSWVKTKMKIKQMRAQIEQIFCHDNMRTSASRLTMLTSLWFLSVVSQPDRPPLHLWRIEDLFKLVLKSLDGAQRRDFRSVFSWTDLSAA